ncbi:MAG: glycoside hydrolase [Euryarchaeota archaeon]|nr:glycoside hydrolase [Euryarchaeota archaeon]
MIGSHSSPHLLICLLMLVVALAGCNAPAEKRDAPEVPDKVLPPGCDPEHAAVPHLADGRVATSEVVVIPCLLRLGARSFEPTIGIASDGSVFVYPVRHPFPGETARMARSTDEGATWEILTPNTNEIPTHPYSLDPYLYLDPTTDRIFADDLMMAPPTCGMMSISDDDGTTWKHGPSGCAITDHVTIFAGVPTVSTTSDYPNVVYRCGNSGGGLNRYSTMVSCQRSLDGGTTWMPPGEPVFTFGPGLTGRLPEASPIASCTGGIGHGATGASGTVFIPRGHCGQPWLAISDDEGATWERVQVSELGSRCTPFEGPGGDCDHDAAVAVDAAGNVFFAWITAERWLALTHSTDGGHTWSPAQNITAPGVEEAAFVELAAGTGGRIAVAYLGTADSPRPDFELDAYATTAWDGYLALSHDALAEVPLFHSARLNPIDDPLIRGDCGPGACGRLGDFIDIRIAPDGAPWAPFVDACFEECRAGGPQDGNEGLVGRLWGGPSLRRV